MKVVLNTAPGGFSLSPHCVRLARLRGAAWARHPDSVLPGELHREGRRRPQDSCDIYPRQRFAPDFRADPVLVGLVEELGHRAGGPHAELKVFEVEEMGVLREDEDGYESWEMPPKAAPAPTPGGRKLGPRAYLVVCVGIFGVYQADSRGQAKIRAVAGAEEAGYGTRRDLLASARAVRYPSCDAGPWHQWGHYYTGSENTDQGVLRQSPQAQAMGKPQVRRAD